MPLISRSLDCWTASCFVSPYRGRASMQPSSCADLKVPVRQRRLGVSQHKATRNRGAIGAYSGTCAQHPPPAPATLTLHPAVNSQHPTRDSMHSTPWETCEPQHYTHRLLITGRGGNRETKHTQGETRQSLISFPRATNVNGHPAEPCVASQASPSLCQHRNTHTTPSWGRGSEVLLSLNRFPTL